MHKDGTHLQFRPQSSIIRIKKYWTKTSCSRSQLHWKQEIGSKLALKVWSCSTSAEFLILKQSKVDRVFTDQLSSINKPGLKHMCVGSILKSSLKHASCAVSLICLYERNTQRTEFSTTGTSVVKRAKVMSHFMPPAREGVKTRRLCLNHVGVKNCLRGANSKASFFKLSQDCHELCVF